MPNPWLGYGNPYTREEVRERLQQVIHNGNAIIGAGAGTGISAKFIERGGADFLITYNSGRYRMAGHGSTAGLMSYGDANAVAMEIGEFEVLPVVQEIPVLCGVHGTDPRRRMWHFLGQVKDMGFSGVNNFPTHCIVDGHYRQTLEETGMGFEKEVAMIALARRMELFTAVYVFTPEEGLQMAEAGADAIIVHSGCTVGGSIGVVDASQSIASAIEQIHQVIDTATSKSGRDDIIFLSHGGPVNTPEDVRHVLSQTQAVGFVGASSLERMAVESSLTDLTLQFKSLGTSGEDLTGSECGQGT